MRTSVGYAVSQNDTTYDLLQLNTAADLLRYKKFNQPVRIVKPKMVLPTSVCDKVNLVSETEPRSVKKQLKRFGRSKWSWTFEALEASVPLTLLKNLYFFILSFVFRACIRPASSHTHSLSPLNTPTHSLLLSFNHSLKHIHSHTHTRILSLTRTKVESMLGRVCRVLEAASRGILFFLR